jgi:cell division protein FtsB
LTIIKVLEYAENIDSPALSVVFILLIVLSLFYGWRKLTTSEYVTAGKEAFDEQRKLYLELKEEHTKLKEEIVQLKIELETCRDVVRKINGD